MCIILQIHCNLYYRTQINIDCQEMRAIRNICDLCVLTDYPNKSAFKVKCGLSSFLHDLARTVEERVQSSFLFSRLKNLNFTIMVNFIRRWLGEILSRF